MWKQRIVRVITEEPDGRTMSKTGNVFAENNNFIELHNIKNKKEIIPISRILRIEVLSDFQRADELTGEQSLGSASNDKDETND